MPGNGPSINKQENKHKFSYIPRDPEIRQHPLRPDGGGGQLWRGQPDQRVRLGVGDNLKLGEMENGIVNF